ncbi:hypothetical protein [Devosia sp. SL43]|uniref:hypothetical protein n=1 Tax=Devosia sp. SL43 TaxID=2806348 RepID=UPI001F2DB1B5|nr:hypothetical protein [Devosia sp. SL43]UJW87286.1 hypothetical protein IM737_08640 [Devosia sp. SL43]
MAAGLAVGSIAQDSGVIGDNTGLLAPQTEGRGPSESIVEFVVAPHAATVRLSEAGIAVLAESFVADAVAARRNAELELGIQAVGDSAGGLGVLATLAEHALFADQFGPVNNALTNIGGVLALAQVSRDIWNGRTDAALTGAIKGWMSFAIGKWGWGSLQVGGIALFVVDVTLREWQRGVSDIAVEGLRCHYTAWYRENPRPISDWKTRVWQLYLLAEQEGREGFAAYLDIELNRYANLALQDPEWITYGDCSTSTMGLGHSDIEAKLTDEHKLLLGKLLVEEVLPEIGERAWRRNLDAQVIWANTHLLPRLNKVLTLEIATYGFPAGTRMVMPLPNGGEWSGKLRPDGTFRAAITKFALAKAGFPEVVRIETEAGIEERRLSLSGDRLVAMFGTPETPLVSRFQLSEQAGQCRITRIAADGSREEEVQDIEIHAPQDVDFAMLPNGNWVMGHYAQSGGWSIASPGATVGDRIDFGAPLWDGITGFKGCVISFLGDDQLARTTCSVERFDSKQVSTRLRIDRLCSSPAQLDISGVFTALVAGETTYYPLDGPEGQVIVDTLKRGIGEGVVGGFPSMPDLPDLSRMPALPGGN